MACLHKAPVLSSKHTLACVFGASLSLPGMPALSALLKHKTALLGPLVLYRVVDAYRIILQRTLTTASSTCMTVRRTHTPAKAVSSSERSDCCLQTKVLFASATSLQCILGSRQIQQVADPVINTQRVQ